MKQAFQVPFSQRLLPALAGKGFRQDDIWVWCGSVVHREDGRAAFLFAATADGPGAPDGHPGHYYAENTWNMAFPLR